MNICKLACTCFLWLALPAVAQSGPDALFKAAESGNLADIRKALTSGVSVNVADPAGWTPLLVAAGEGQLAAVQALVKAGANVNAASKKGETALMAAVLSGNAAVVKYLLAEGADKAAATSKGLTAADIAVQTKKLEITKLLAPVGKNAPAAQAASSKQASAKEAAAVEAYQKGRYDEAAGLFKELVGLDPKNVPAWFFLGQSLDKSGQKAEARSAYEKSLLLQPSGEYSDRTRKLVAGMQREALLKDLPDLTAETRELLATSPLIASLPDSPAIRCEGRRISAGKTYIFRNSFERGSAGIARGESTSGNEGESKSTRLFVMTLGGLGGLAKPRELFSVEGSFFPLKAGNRFSYVQGFKTGEISRIITSTCQVLEPVQTAGLGFPDRANDVYQLKCEEKSQWRGGGLDGKQALSPSSIYRLCSNSMGLCLYQWDVDRGTAIPDFAGGYTFTDATGSKMFNQERCEVVP